jgi:hypothetical protein
MVSWNGAGHNGTMIALSSASLGHLKRLHPTHQCHHILKSELRPPQKHLPHHHRRHLRMQNQNINVHVYTCMQYNTIEPDRLKPELKLPDLIGAWKHRWYEST